MVRGTANPGVLLIQLFLVLLLLYLGTFLALLIRVVSNRMLVLGLLGLDAASALHLLGRLSRLLIFDLGFSGRSSFFQLLTTALYGSSHATSVCLLVTDALAALQVLLPCPQVDLSVLLLQLELVGFTVLAILTQESA